MSHRPPEFDIRGSDVPRRRFPAGRVRFSLGVPHSRSSQAKKRRQGLTTLRYAGGWDIMEAIQDGHLHVAEVCDAVHSRGEHALADLRSELRTRNAGRVPTFGEARETYLVWYAENREVQSATQTRYRLGQLAAQGLEEIRLDEVAKAQVEVAIAAISKNDSTRENLRLAASGLFTWHVHEEAERARVAGALPRFTVNPASKVERREGRTRVTTATEEQVQGLLSASEIHQRAYLRAFVGFGLRRDELIHLRLHDDLDVRTWLLRVQARGPDPRCLCPQCRLKGWSPKSAKGHRTLKIPADPPHLRAMVDEYLEAYPANPSDYVFRDARGKLWTRTSLRLDFKGLCERAGVMHGQKVPGGLTPHTLRHTLATRLVQAGVRESIGAAILGITVDVFVKTYVHLTPDDLASGLSRAPSYE